MSGELYVIALYRFETVTQPALLRQKVQRVAMRRGVRGTLIIAAEGLNGTLAGTREDLEAVLASCDGFIKLDPPRFDPVAEWPFGRLFVHLKNEIVTMGVDAIDPNLQRGSYVDPKDWNDLIADPDIVVVDTRNDFEVRLGTFSRAENPSTNAFTEFPDWADDNAERLRAAKGVAMFCTGGIRCEKATSYLKTIGVRDTFHLRGGILRYLDTVPKEESDFKGDCFVFDDRVAVGPDLAVNESIRICFGCRHAVTESMRADERYESGVSCPDCYDRTTTEQKAKYRARHQQFMRVRQTDGDT